MVRGQNHCGDDGGGSAIRNALGTISQESCSEVPGAISSSSQTLLRVDTTCANQGDGSRSPSHPRTPSAVEVEDPDGRKSFIYRDNHSATERVNSIASESFYYHPKSGSETSFASIETVADLGFSKHATAKTAADASSDSLHPGQAYHGKSNASSDQYGGGFEEISTGERLTKLLRKAYKHTVHKPKPGESPKPGKSTVPFIPISEIERILSEEEVQEVLKQEIPELSDAGSKAELDRLTQDVCGVPSRRRLFAILLLGSKAACIRCLVESGITDMDLPFVTAPNSSESVHTSTGKPVKCFESWKTEIVEWLLGQQHAVASPFFDLGSENLFFYPLRNMTVLPFLDTEETGEGGHSSVSKVRIHPAHHNFPVSPDTEGQYFAVKTLNTRKRDEYEGEVEVLRRFSGQNKGHPHLIRLLLTYQHEDKYHMVFPWANGNLSDFWTKNKTPERTQTLVCWMLSQCHGIADGVRQIHGKTPRAGLGQEDNLKNTGRHGDIKPENILWFENHNGAENHLFISDFGLSVFHSHLSQSRDKYPPGWSPTYRPPECDLLTATISVRYDIWTLGCLLLDFLTWYLLGFEAYTTFNNARVEEEGVPDSDRIVEDKFFILSWDGNIVRARLKRSVLNWMDHLHALPHCPKFAHDLLRIIHRGLLHPDKAARWDCLMTVAELDAIREKCMSSEEYCLAPHKWEGGPLETFTVSDRIVNNDEQGIDSIIAGPQQQDGSYNSHRSLSPVSGQASRTSTPPMEFRAEPLEINPATQGTPAQPPTNVPDVPSASAPAASPLGSRAPTGLERSLRSAFTGSTRKTNSGGPLLPTAEQSVGRGKRVWRKVRALCCCFGPG